MKKNPNPDEKPRKGRGKPNKLPRVSPLQSAIGLAGELAFLHGNLRPRRPSARIGNLDERIRQSALYDISGGNTLYCDPVDVWKRASAMKKAIRLGEWGEGEQAIANLEDAVRMRWAPVQAMTDKQMLEDVLEMSIEMSGV